LRGRLAPSSRRTADVKPAILVFTSGTESITRMSAASVDDDDAFRDALAGLRNGDFSRLEPLFHGLAGDASERSRIMRWHEEGRFAGHAVELSEALSCACFVGQVKTAEYLLKQGVDASAGTRTGTGAFHWAADRGQLDVVRLLLRHQAPLETRNMHGGTVLGGAVWSAVHEPRPQHASIIEELLKAGADPKAVDRPTGDPRIDSILDRFVKASLEEA
jgi:ankyrin repeat protein